MKGLDGQEVFCSLGTAFWIVCLKAYDQWKIPARSFRESHINPTSTFRLHRRQPRWAIMRDVSCPWLRVRLSTLALKSKVSGHSCCGGSCANCFHADAGLNVCSHRAVVLSAPATILAAVAKFQMICGKAIGHGLCGSQKHGVSALISHACFVVVVLVVASTDGFEPPWNCTVSARNVNAWVCALATDSDI